MYNIFIADDDVKLVKDAVSSLNIEFEVQQVPQPRRFNIKNTAEQFVHKYTITEIDLAQAMDIEYWDSLGINADDTVVLDIDFQEYKDPKTLQKVGLMYNGKDVLDFLDEQKQQHNFLNGLERVLVATSNVRMIEPQNPELSFIRGFDIYGLAKGKDGEGNIIDYGKSVVQFLNAMYEDLGQQKVRALNYGLRDRSDIRERRI